MTRSVFSQTVTTWRPYITREGEVWGVFYGCAVWFTPFCRCYCKGVCNTMFKGLITVGRELRQQHPTIVQRRDVPRARLDNWSRGCRCRNSRQIVINPDYNMTKQLCMKRIYDLIRSISPPNRAPSPTCLHVTHLSFSSGNCSFTHPVIKGPRARGTLI